MKYREERNRIVIEPTNEVEIAYIEEVFGMKRDGDAIELVRKNAMSLSCIAYLETKIKPQPRDMVMAWQPHTLAEFLANTSSPSDLTNAVADFAFKMHEDVQKLNVIDDDALYMQELNKAIEDRNWTRVASMAALLARARPESS